MSLCLERFLSRRFPLASGFLFLEAFVLLCSEGIKKPPYHADSSSETVMTGQVLAVMPPVRRARAFSPDPNY